MLIGLLYNDISLDLGSISLSFAFKARVINEQKHDFCIKIARKLISVYLHVMNIYNHPQ